MSKYNTCMTEKLKKLKALLMLTGSMNYSAVINALIVIYSNVGKYTPMHLTALCPGLPG